MLLFLGTLIHLFLKAQSEQLQLTATQKWVLYIPFMVYLGWISVATIANMTALLVAYNWSGFGIDPIYWSAFMICIAVIIAWYMLYQFKNIAFALVVTWALWGILHQQGPTAPILANLTSACIGLLITASLLSYFKNLRKNKIA